MLDRPDELRRDIDGDPLVGFVHIAADLVEDYLRAADLHLEPLAAHLLDQDRELEFSAAADFVRVGRFGGRVFDGDVTQDLLVQPILDLARGDELAFAPG